MRRPLTIFLLTVSVSGLAASAAAAQTPVPPEPRIRPAVMVSGVDVGNLTLAEAQLRLEQTLGPVLAQDIVVTVARRQFRLEMADIGFVFRADKTAVRAFNAGQAAPPLPDGTLPPASAEPSLRFERKPLWRFAKRTGKAVGVPPRNATLRITLTRMIKRPGKKGRKMGVRALLESIKATLANPQALRELKPGRRTLTPQVRTRELKRIYRTVVTIDRDHFRLRLFKRLKFVAGYGVAVGMPAYPTPTGLFAIQSKQVNPTWTAPNSPWAGELAGQQIAGGAADNPLRARWMGVSGSVGIHGTGQPWTIGTRASHGCIRMTVPDVIALFGRVSIGTPVLIE
jgi:lipoprotein-anchoring transpeptidase ErfK/SrfK